MIDFNVIANRTSTPCRKLDQRVEMYGTEDVLPLWIADMDFSVAPEIRAAVQKFVAEDVYGYFYETDFWKKAVKSWYEYRYQLDLDIKSLHYTPTVIRTIVYALLALSHEGDGVVICDPVYDPYPNYINTLGRKVIRTALVFKEGRYTYDFEDLDQKLANAKVMILCSPNNPMGIVWTKEELSTIASLCKKHNVLVISDEVHSDLLLGNVEHTPFFTVNEWAFEHSIVVNSTSKTFNTPGMQGAYCIINGKELRDKYFHFIDNTYLAECQYQQLVIFESAYMHARGWYEEVKTYLKDNLSYVREFISINCPRIKIHNYGATYLLLLDMSDLFDKPEDIFNFFVKEARLGLSPGPQYGEVSKLCMRFNFGSPRSIIEEGMQRLKQAYENRGF